mmetsp:Transcript_63293/g.119860  ORF Transcript_63293/g.119860 Transcript_63293/m.119860 type:complete len:608 (+) Transcript_63293:118-1941(+)
MVHVQRAARASYRAVYQAMHPFKHPLLRPGGIVGCKYLCDHRFKEHRGKSTLTTSPGVGEDASPSVITDAALLKQQVAAISELQRELESMKNQLHDSLRRIPLHFSVGQYNILAGYLGNNMEPWFLYGIDLTEEKRKAIIKLHKERDSNGKYLNIGWPNYVRGVLSQEEIKKVEDVHHEVFSWDKRKDRVIEVIRDLDVDLLSIVECDNYEETFRPALETMGYTSLWRQRPRSSSKDGCCIAWRSHLFQLEASKAVEYVDSHHSKTKDRIALLVLLKSRITGDVVCFVSTHLARNPEQQERDTLRSRQLGQVARAISSFAIENNALAAPVVLTGDLNATQFGRLFGMALVASLLRNDSSAHPFVLDSKDVPSRATSVTTARQMRIDAILYQSKKMVLVDAHNLPQLTVANPIPNSEHPSDHVPVKARFRLRTWLEVTEKSACEWYWRLAGKGNFNAVTLEELCDAFMLYDHDGAGYVTAKKIREAIVRLIGEGATPAEEIDFVLSKLPAHGMDIASFVDAFKTATKEQGFPALDDIQDLFAFCDKDQNGCVDVNELKAMFDDCSPAKVPDEEVEALFNEIDKDGSGGICMQEYTQHVTKVWVSKFNL